VKPGVVAEFDAPDALLRAVRELRQRGYRDIDAFTPYPVKGLEAALGTRRSPINWMTLPVWLAAAIGAYLVQWYCNAYDYPLDVGGRPPHSPPAFVPITFEMAVLAASLASFVLFLVWAGLPELYHPLFSVPHFERATIDRFFLGVDASDPSFDCPRLASVLLELGAARVTFPRVTP
jgi:Alternative complex III, ActD subunit